MKSPQELLSTLVKIADAMVEPRAVQISDEAIRTLKDEIRHASSQMSDGDYQIDYEARCLIECIAELAYARTDLDRKREERAMMYINSFRCFVRMDLEATARRIAAATP